MIKFNQSQLEAWLLANLDVRNEGKTEWNCVCPFHQAADTKRPDLWVNVEKGVFHCLSSACGQRGTVTYLVKQVTGLSWQDARRELGRPGVEALQRCLVALRPPKEAPLSLSWDLVYSYQSTHYWRERKYEDRTINYFLLGFDHERDHALIPFFSQQGEPMCFIRRQLEGHPRYLYPTGFPNESAIYNLHQVKPARPVIVVEGATDAHRVWEAGYPNVVALMGSEITPDKARRLKHFQLISFLDADIAGVTSTIKLRKAVGRIIHRVDYPDHLQGEDPGSLSPQNIDICLKRLVPMI